MNAMLKLALKILVVLLTLLVLIFFPLAPPVTKLMLVLLQRFDNISEITGLIPTAIVSLVLLFAWAAHMVGMPELLGGFAAGLALSWRFFLSFGMAMASRGKWV